MMPPDGVVFVLKAKPHFSKFYIALFGKGTIQLTDPNNSYSGRMPRLDVKIQSDS